MSEAAREQQRVRRGRKAGAPLSTCTHLWPRLVLVLPPSDVNELPERAHRYACEVRCMPLQRRRGMPQKFELTANTQATTRLSTCLVRRVVRICHMWLVFYAMRSQVSVRVTSSSTLRPDPRPTTTQSHLSCVHLGTRRRHRIPRSEQRPGKHPRSAALAA